MTKAEIDLNEVSRKLDSLAASVERLTEIALENRRLINNLSLMLATGPQPNADMSGQGFTNADKNKPRPGTEIYRDPFSYGGGIIPASPSAESEDEYPEEQVQDERVKKYEEENPW